jgi:hypothetical protein
VSSWGWLIGEDSCGSYPLLHLGHSSCDSMRLMTLDSGVDVKNYFFSIIDGSTA